MPKYCTAVFCVLASTGVLLNFFPFFFGAGILKTLPALLLTGVAFACTRPRFKYWIVLGIAFGAVGDYSLANAERTWFLAGLAAFLAGHVAYSIACARNLYVDAARLAIIGIVASATTVLLALVLGRFASAGEYLLMFPVILYVLVMLVMMVLAVLHQSNSWRIAAGAIVFIISDAHIAVNHMLLETPVLGLALSGYTTYYAAQYLIVNGATREAHALGASPRPAV